MGAHAPIFFTEHDAWVSYVEKTPALLPEPGPNLWKHYVPGAWHQWFVSVASKLLYLTQPEYVVIYDRNARIALGLPLQVGYGRFLQRWKNAFAEKQLQIRESLAITADLPDQAFSIGVGERGTLSPVAQAALA